MLDVSPRASVASMLIAGIVALVAPAASSQSVFYHCGMKGDAKGARERLLNPVKNRYVAPTAQQINHAISLGDILKPSNDVRRWNTNQGAEIIAYVASAHPGGIESCNCRTKDIKLRDTHIDVVINPADAPNKNRHVIVEISPRWRVIMARTRNGLGYNRGTKSVCGEMDENFGLDVLRRRACASVRKYESGQSKKLESNGMGDSSGNNDASYERSAPKSAQSSLSPRSIGKSVKPRI